MNAAIAAALVRVQVPAGIEGKTITANLQLIHNMNAARLKKILHSRFLHLRRNGQGVMSGIDSEETYIAMELLEALVPGMQDHSNDAAMRAHIQAIFQLAAAVGGGPPAWNAIEQHLDNNVVAVANRDPDSVFLFFASVAKQGNCTARWCRKRASALSQANNRDFNLDKDDVRQLWDRFGSKINIPEANWIADWENFGNAAQNDFLIIRNVINQSRYTGLASLKVSSDAYNDFPDFPWAALEGLTGEPVQAQVVAINGRPWAGLANDTLNLRNAARSELFRHTVYTAKKLYKAVLGRDTLDDLKANGEGLRHKLTCDAWITGYVNGMAVPNYPGAAGGAACARSTKVNVTKWISCTYVNNTSTKKIRNIFVYHNHSGKIFILF